MRLMGLQAIYRAPRISDPHPEYRIHPYLLKGFTIERANQVWCADITYIPVRCGFLYLVAVMDWASRHVLAWRLSNTLDAGFCVDAFDDALARHGTPEIFNTHSQFTSVAFTGGLHAVGIQISMDGRGRCMDNIFIERLWRSLKYEAVYLHELADGLTARRVIGEWIGFYTTERPHSALGGRTPAEACRAYLVLRVERGQMRRELQRAEVAKPREPRLEMPLPIRESGQSPGNAAPGGGGVDGKSWRARSVLGGSAARRRRGCYWRVDDGDAGGPAARPGAPGSS